MNKTSDTLRVLAIEPTTWGFGYAIMEAPDELIDWGMKRAANEKNEECLQQVAQLIARYRPGILLVEGGRQGLPLRSDRVQKLLSDISTLALSQKIKTRTISRRMVREAFGAIEVDTKQRIAEMIARQYPELAKRLPPPRKAWMNLDPRMCFFFAVALSLTYFYYRRKK